MGLPACSVRSLVILRHGLVHLPCSVCTLLCIGSILTWINVFIMIHGFYIKILFQLKENAKRENVKTLKIQSILQMKETNYK